MTLGLSMGAQTDLEKMREETGASIVGEEEPVEATPLSQAAETVGSTLSVVETTITMVATSLVPSWDQVENAVGTVCGATVDLSLPTAAKVEK